jgi:predicted phage tail protein
MAQIARKTILLGGSLGREFGREHNLVIHSVAEGIRALGVLFPKIAEKIRDGQYIVFSGKRDLTKEQLHHPNGQDVIRIVPVIAGRKNGGLFSVIVGVVLIVAGFFTGGTTWGPAMMMAGGAMALSGAIMMLSPQTTGTDALDSPDNRPSYSFNGSVNTEAQGNPVPLPYGEGIWGSAVISAGAYSEDRA